MQGFITNARLCNKGTALAGPKKANKMSRALHAAEKLDKSAIHGTVLKGHDFNRAINTLK